jgi:hypothetical protein
MLSLAADHKKVLQRWAQEGKGNARACRRCQGIPRSGKGNTGWPTPRLVLNIDSPYPGTLTKVEGSARLTSFY